MSRSLDIIMNCGIKRYASLIVTFPDCRQKTIGRNYSKAHLKRNKNKVTQHPLVAARVTRFSVPVPKWVKWQKKNKRHKSALWDYFVYRKITMVSLWITDYQHVKNAINKLQWKEGIQPKTGQPPDFVGQVNLTRFNSIKWLQCFPNFTWTVKKLYVSVSFANWIPVRHRSGF